MGYDSVAEAIAATAGPGTLVCMSSHGAYGPEHTLPVLAIPGPSDG